MGTEIQSNLLGHYSMIDLNDNSNICSWPPYPRENMLPGGHFHNGYMPRADAAEVYPVLGKDIVRKTMLEHEAIFRKQVHDLHRLYTKQKEFMSEFKRKEMFKERVSVESSLASSPLPSQITSEDVAKWHSPGVPGLNSSYNNLRPFVSVAEGIRSPASSARANNTQAADDPRSNGIGVKSLDILESSRSSTVRRKMFDLQLPADQYIDDDEPQQIKDDKSPEILVTLPKEDARSEHRNGVILAGDGVRQISGPRLYTGARSFADLNEPLEVDVEATGCAHIKPHINGFLQSSNLGSSKNVSSSHSVFANNGRGWLSILEVGEEKAKKPVSQGDQMRMPLISQVVTEQNQLGRSQERRIHGADTAESDNCRESVASSHLSPHYLFGSPPDPVKSWCNSAMNLERQGSYSCSQKVPSQNGTFLDTTSSSYMKVPQPGDNRRLCGDKQQLQGELPYRNGFHPGSFPSGPGEPPSLLRLAVYDHHGYRSENVALKEIVRNRSDEKHNWSSGSEVRNSARVIDLNATLLNGSSGGPVKVKKQEDRPKIPPWLRSETCFSNEAAMRQVDLNQALLGGPTSSLIDKEKKMEDRPQIPPWLKQETAFRNKDSVRAGLTCLESGKDEAGWSVSCSNNLEMNWITRGQCTGDKRILGFHISEKGVCPWEGPVCGYDRKTRLLDINLPCDSVSELAKPSSGRSFVADKGNDLKVSHPIDLNLVFSEDEASAMPCFPSRMGKRIPEIDLEDPAVPDDEFREEHGKKPRQSIDEGMTSAVEAIVAISSPSTVHYSLPAGCTENPLNWLADVAMSCFIDVEMRSATIVSNCGQSPRQNEEYTLEEMDDFESMTLKLTETKPEDYFAKPLVPDIPKEDESASNPTSGRPRRGQAGRGRKRKDFQRDILPGLTSLSRHEVTEDLQTFGGLMRATGHVWQPGLTRRNSRNGSARGRRRGSGIVSRTARTYAPTPILQQHSAMDAGDKDMSLTSWGKTTRRPRMQRFPAGNNPPDDTRQPS